ncbi:3-hydroxyacyl-CoA dehydrogenase NAD-binding domain-containing protein [Patulibacter brassicae]|uniref:3-hydroxyacyl-CoA dehydrogenase NAD-binding domain-containing protein n=1 Tax=Patulibacter brassicae TaxID=1705717 RepID=A0ABU4VPT7_9ACTN|nr:3-hydroxyacyl-CoA dehydrogenase NAD-binding domain-containing protein [Patulibacter brassicae]MDX8153347.1 3-hydroxyacyl-CoA dehydrogenase NAD-binding domain-containing protein [Patulibacter brassicae]
MSFTSTIRWESLEGGVVHLILDDPNQSANTMNADFMASLRETVDRLEARKDQITGVVVSSAKKTFFAGGDLNDLRAAGPEAIVEMAARIDGMKGDLRRLETLGKPVVSIIDGAALGGGLEIALATHRRIVVDSPKIQIGLPEVSLGLLPGAGGIVRTVRLLGLTNALMQVLLQGQRHRPGKAKEIGLVDELVASPDDLLPAALKWIGEHAEAAQPWDVKGYKIPGGAPSSPKIAANLPALPATLRKQLKGANMPAPRNIMAAAIEGAQVDVDNALKIESRYFIDLAGGQVAKNMIQAFFFDMQAAGARDKSREPWKATKVVVLGAGMMGAAIAYVCAKAGIEVVLKDVSLEAAQKGKAYSEKLVAKGVERGKVTQEKGDALLARILPTEKPEDAAGADAVIEAVFEDPALKAKVFAEIEPHLAPDALLGSNTSTLPITGLAEGVSRPTDFIGLHFFSPVDKMPLLEIIKGEQTSDETLARALDLARQIAKTPIVVNDSRGFFTSRVIGTFLYEGMNELAEGVPAASVEQAARQAGYPAPILQLMDELTLTLFRKVRDETVAAIEAEGGTFDNEPAFAVLDKMVDELGRPGRAGGAGFYDYDEAGKRGKLWPGLADAFGAVHSDSNPAAQIPLKDLTERMLFREALETVKCVDEGVLESVADANVGSILGIGFPAWTGGVLQYINGYPHPASTTEAAGTEVGPKAFVARARELAEQYGERFEPPASLVAAAEANEPYADPLKAAATA